MPWLAAQEVEESVRTQSTRSVPDDESTPRRQPTGREKALQRQNFSFHGYYEGKELNYRKTRIEAIRNTSQDPAAIPTLENGLEIVLENPGVFPVETINVLNKGRLGNFYTRLPQYSQIDESCIPPYSPPS